MVDWDTGRDGVGEGVGSESAEAGSWAAVCRGLLTLDLTFPSQRHAMLQKRGHLCLVVRYDGINEMASPIDESERRWIAIIDEVGQHNIFAGFACGEASAAEKDPCREAQLVRPIGLLSDGVCSCARSIAGLCCVGSEKCKAKQVRREVRIGSRDSTLCARPGGELTLQDRPKVVCTKEAALKVNVVGPDCFFRQCLFNLLMSIAARQ